MTRATQSATLPGNPQNLSPKEKKEREKLIKAITAAVTLALAKQWAENRATEFLSGVGLSITAARKILTRFYIGLAIASYFAIREMAKVRLNDDSPNLPDEDEIDALTNQELLFEVNFASKGTDRIIANIIDVAEREQAKGTHPDQIRSILRDEIHNQITQENRFSSQRIGAIQQRMERRTDEQGVKKNSPEGAYWLLDLGKKTHTADCVTMANNAWSWRVLNVIRPSNRHYGCGCRLIPLDLARGAGMPNADVVRDDVPTLAAAATR